MKRKGHLITTTVVFLILWYIYLPLKLPEIIFFIFLSLLPDVDLLWKGHRNWFTHSIILPVLWIVWYGSLIPMFFRISFLLTISLHLICDLKWHDVKGRRPGGTYCVNLFKNTLKWQGSHRWYYLNGLIGIIISGLFFGGIIVG